MNILILIGVTAFVMIRISNLQHEINELKKIINCTSNPKKEKNNNNINKKDTLPIVKTNVQTTKVITNTNSKQNNSKNKIGLEQQFGTFLPVWIGGIALALSGFFLVKYSIENNFLNPVVRITLGTIFGISLLYASKAIRNKPNLSNGIRINQSLTGSGITILYLTSYSASALYNIIPAFASFTSMTIITIYTLIMSIRYGIPIAIIGMIGGFSTPILLNAGSENIPFLFLYLYFTTSGLLITIRKKSWWWLSIPTITISLLWVLGTLFSSSYNNSDNIWLGLFLTGISTTVFILRKEENNNNTISSILNYISFGGSLLIMGMITNISGFDLMEWSLFGLLTIGGILLAYVNNKIYGFIPWISMLTNIIMIYFWKESDSTTTLMTIIIFALIYTISSYSFIWRSKTPIFWAKILGASLLLYYFLSYSKLHTTEFLSEFKLFWGLTSFILASISVHIVQQTIKRLKQHLHQESILAIFSILCTIFISTGLLIELKREFLSVAFSTQILAISWISKKVSIKILKPLTIILSCVFGILLLPQIILLLQLTIYNLIETKIHFQNSIPIVSWPIFQLGIPAIMFFGSSYLNSKYKNNRISYAFDTISIVLVAIMGYYVTRNMLHPDENILFIKAEFLERGIITNILFLYSLLCFWIGRKIKHKSFSLSAIVLTAIAIFRVVYFDIIVHNPFYETHIIKGTVIFNTLLVAYGMPIIWIHFIKKELAIINKQEFLIYTGIFTLLSLFTLITLNVRYLFSEFLSQNILSSNAEIYCYSFVWLLLGIALLFSGLIKRDKMIRYASLIVMVLVVSKVFLYDVSELEGLYRVFSFFGLGLILISLSYIYSRFVFKSKE